MTAIRKTAETSNDNERALLDVFASNNYQQVIFFASPQDGGSSTDGPNTNWPLMSALVLDHQGNYTIFDGVFLHASRHNRYSEVKAVLDAAMEAEVGDVFFAPDILPFTSHMSENGAAAAMLSVRLEMLDQESRAKYFQLLSPSMTEAMFAQ